MASNQLSHRRWRELRAAVLATSDKCHLCPYGGADTVDHIIERANGGAVMDVGNLRPAHGEKRAPGTFGPDDPGCPGNYGRSNGHQLKTSRQW